MREIRRPADSLAVQAVRGRLTATQVPVHLGILTGAPSNAHGSSITAPAAGTGQALLIVTPTVP